MKLRNSASLFNEIRELIESTKQKIAININSDLVQLYWENWESSLLGNFEG